MKFRKTGLGAAVRRRLNECPQANPCHATVPSGNRWTISRKANDTALAIAMTETIMNAAEKRGIVPGIHCGSPDDARKMIDKGFQLVALMSDNTMLAAATKRMILTARGQDAGSVGGTAGSYRGVRYRERGRRSSR